MDTIHSDIFPDGTPVDGWFHNTSIPELTKLGKQYIITDYGIHDDGRIYTDNFQKLIDLVYNAGGGVIVIPHGTYMTGALLFRQGVNLYIEGGATLMGSDDISDYPVCETRIEGETCQYFAALINASGIDGFTLCGTFPSPCSLYAAVHAPCGRPARRCTPGMPSAPRGSGGSFSAGRCYRSHTGLLPAPRGYPHPSCGTPARWAGRRR